MTISDAQFTAWLRSGGRMALLCEQKYAYESGGAPVEGTLYLSMGEYRTGPSDSPANVIYRDCIAQPPVVSRAVDPDVIGGLTSISVGSMKLTNDGSFDFIQDLVIDGREARFYLGDPTWARSDFRLVMVLVAEVATAPDLMSIEIQYRDLRLLLDRQIAGDVVHDERRKPLVFRVGSGTCDSIELVAKDASLLQYYVLQNFDSDARVVTVRDNGLPLSAASIRVGVTNATLTANAATDTLTLVGHGYIADYVLTFTGSAIFAGMTLGTRYWILASGLTADNFQLSLTKGGSPIDITGTTFAGSVGIQEMPYADYTSVDGTLQLSSSPAGVVTADVIGYSPTQTRSVSSGPGDLLAALIADYGGIGASQIDSATFSAIYAASAAGRTPTGRAVIERENLLDVLEDVARTSQIHYGADYQAVIHAFRLDLSGLSSATATRSIGESDLLSDPKIANARVITGTVVVNSKRNYRTHSFGEFAGAVPDSTRNTLSAQYRESGSNTAPTGTAYSTNWQGFHKTARGVEVGGAFEPSGIDLTAVADEILGDIKPHVKTIDVELGLDAYAWRLGEVVTLTMSRYGFASGVKCRVVAVAPDFGGGKVSMQLVTRVAPDISGAH